MKQRTYLAAVSTAVALLMTAGACFAQAQDGQQGRRRGGRGGGRGLMGLVGIPEVQKEISMQQAQIDLVNGMREQSRQNRGNRADFQNLSREELQKRFAERRAQEEKQLGEVLDAKQMKRLKELDIQQSGPQALSRSSVQEALKLSAEQKTKVQAIQDEQRTATQGLFQRGQNGQRPSREEFQAIFQKMRDAQNTANTKLLGVLTDAQKKQFTTMQGAPFTFPQRTRGRRGQQPNQT